MTSRPCDVAVLIGHFQPFHNGHAALLQRALACAPTVCVVLGSAGRACDLSHPFSAEERTAMITAALSEADRGRVRVLPIRDHFDDRRWATMVRTAVARCCPAGGSVALIGTRRDAGRRWLRRFSGWESVTVASQNDIDVAGLRRAYFEARDAQAMQTALSALVPPAVCDYLRDWAQLPHHARLRVEQRWLDNYHRTWGRGPFVTVDALVRTAGHVLLVQRGHPPGTGLWALPGGFLEPRERVLDGALRELREETGLALPESELEGALSAVLVADQPGRSVRGRTITHVHCFDLELSHLPEVAGGDDAAAARWVAIDALPAMEAQCFEDHFQILDHFLGITA